jgi:hypothetical protein
MDTVFRYEIDIKLVLFWLPSESVPRKTECISRTTADASPRTTSCALKHHSTTSATRTSPRVIAGGLRQERAMSCISPERHT